MEKVFFHRSPFALTASADTAGCWAGRAEILDKLNRMRGTFERRSDSTLDLVWANLGAGKSHLLYHLSFMLTEHGRENVVPTVVELPEQVRSFQEVYRRIATQLPDDMVANAVSVFPHKLKLPELKQAAQVTLHGGSREKELVREWITGGRPHLTELRSCTGITRRIEDDISAADCLCSIIAALSHQNMRLVLMLDEFQRVAVLKLAAREALLSNLRSIFSSCPQHLSVILAAAFRVEKNAMDILTPELKTLLGRKPSISLPEMNAEEALDFIRGRFAYFRPSGFSGKAYAPFQEAAVVAIIDFLKVKARPLIPRELLQAHAYCYDEAAGRDEIGPKLCRDALESMRWDDE